MKENLHEVIPFLIEQASKKARRYSQREFDERNLGITVDQWVLLKLIDQHSGISQRELAELSLRDGASITRSLDLLEKNNLIARNPIEGNRRQYAITIEEKGQQFISENMDMVNAHRTQLTAGFSIEEIQQLKNFLVRIANNME